MDHYFTNNNLKSNLSTIKYEFSNTLFTFYVDNGVFSNKHVDEGTRILIEEFLSTNNKNFTALDVGCGYGVIGIIVAMLTNSSFDMVDINKRAVHLSQMNILENKVNAKAFESYAYEQVTSKYDFIFTNPPIRAGLKVVYDILKNSKNYLKENGEVWFVVRKKQGALSIIKELEKTSNISVMKKSKGYFVIKMNFS